MASDGGSRIAAALGLLVSVAWAGGALAQTPDARERAEPPTDAPSPADRERARDLMDAGYVFKTKGDHNGALGSFSAADAIMHVPTTSLAVGLEQIALGELVEAEGTLLAVVSMPAKPREPEPFARARLDAQKALAEIGPRIAKLEITTIGANANANANANGSPGLVVDVDGRVVSDVTGRPIEVNPGHHVVAAAAGDARASEELDVAEGETRKVTLTLREPPPATSAVAVATTRATPAPNRARTYVFWSGVGVAGAGVVAGTITGILSLAATNTARHGCTANQCPPATWADIDRAHTTAALSNGSFIVAGVGAIAVGASFLMAAPHDAGTAPASARDRAITPWVGLGSAGVRGQF